MVILSLSLYHLPYLMRLNLTIEQGRLSDYMSEISERCYHAAWMNNLEYVLWHSIINGARKYGQDSITTQDIITLSILSEKSNCWILVDDETEEMAINLLDWQQKFQHAIQNDPDILLG